MLSFSLVFFAEDLFEPMCLSLGSGRVNDGWIMQNLEFLATAITTKGTHLPETRLPISRLPLLDGYSSHSSILPQLWAAEQP